MKKHALVVETITTLHTDIDWTELQNVEVDFEMLPHFDRHFVAGNIETSLQYALPIVEARLKMKTYDVLVVYSKGVALASLLVSLGLWQGATLLLSPIPNTCKHLLGGNDEDADDLRIYEDLWTSVLKIFEGRNCCICYGDSSDERIMIEDYIVGRAKNVLQVCGSHDWVTNPQAPFILNKCLEALFYGTTFTKSV